MGKNLPCNAEDLGLIPGGRTRIPQVEQPKIMLLIHSQVDAVSDKDTPPEAGKGVSEQRGHGGGPHLSGEYSCRYLYSASHSSVLKTLALLNPCHLSTSRSFVDRSQNH